MENKAGLAVVIKRMIQRQRRQLSVVGGFYIPALSGGWGGSMQTSISMVPRQCHEVEVR